MTRSSDVTTYAANRRDNTIDWPHLLVLVVLLLVPTFVSSDPIFIDSESVNQNQGNDIFIIIFSLEWTYNAIIGSFDTGTEKVICSTNATVFAPGAVIQQPDDSLRDKWFDVLSNSSFTPNDKQVELTPFEMVATKGTFDGKLVPNFLKDLQNVRVPVSLKASTTKEGVFFATWCVDIYYETKSEDIVGIRKEEDAIAVRENASPEKKPEREKRENTEKEANSEDIGGKQVCHKEAASDNVPPQKPDQPEKKENTAGGKKKKNQPLPIVLLLKSLMLGKEFGKKTTEKLTEESTKTFLHVYLQAAKITTMKAIDEGTKQTFEKVTQKVAVGSVTKIVQKGTEKTISGFTIRAGVTTGEKIVKEGARVTVQTSTTSAARITTFGMERQIAHTSAKALTNVKSVTTLGKVAQRAKDGVKGTLAASAVIESGILAFNLCWSYGQLKSGQIEDEEFREQVISDIGASGGSIAGTAAGAAIGTVIFPGVGTWVGSMVGGMVGSYYGSQAGEAMLQD